MFLLCFGRCIFKTGFRWVTKIFKETFIHHGKSFNCDDYVRQAATQMENTKLLDKLSEGDMRAREACYNERCMKNFRNKFRKFFKENHVKEVQKSLEAIAITELCQCISVIQKVCCHCLENLIAPVT